jgi:hypothetical protein
VLTPDDPITWLLTALDPARLMVERGLAPDGWQERLLRSQADRVLILASRQVGKSEVTALAALHRALFYAGSLVLLFAPSQRQSLELFSKVLTSYRILGRPIEAAKELSLSLELMNGSRIVSLPGDEDTTRGYSAPDLVIIDEAARCSDALLVAVSPMLAASREGRLVLLSTPMGRRGMFHDAWSGSSGTWERVKVMAQDCPRISPVFLAEQRLILGERWFNQEFMCSFEETLGQFFSTDAIMAAFDCDEEPLFGAMQHA